MNVFLSRLVASIVAPLLVVIATKVPFLSFLTEPENVTHATAIIVGLVLAIYGAVHRVADRKLNPADVAKEPEMAAVRTGTDS